MTGNDYVGGTVARSGFMPTQSLITTIRVSCSRRLRRLSSVANAHTKRTLFLHVNRGPVEWGERGTAITYVQKCAEKSMGSVVRM